ncbi:hypothetical protein EBT16_10340 [bacterium]|nr:hypothetical protein [bacterium]
MKLAILGFLLVSLGAPALAAEPDQLVGQKAHFKLDKNPKRTSSMIKDGTFLGTIKKYHPDTDAGPAMEVTLDYKFNVQWVGDQTGVETGFIDYQYFTPEFLESLRKNKKYESENFKAIHQGYESVKTLSGKSYPNCDIVLLYDIKDTLNNELRSTLSGFLASIVQAKTQADIQDLKVQIRVYPGIPVLGAVQIDVSGKYEGMAVKAGADYEAH